jgi:hypothetical protein
MKSVRAHTSPFFGFLEQESFVIIRLSRLAIASLPF